MGLSHIPIGGPGQQARGPIQELSVRVENEVPQISQRSGVMSLVVAGVSPVVKNR